MRTGTAAATPGASPVNVSTSAAEHRHQPAPARVHDPARSRTASWPGVAASAARAPSYAARATAPQSPSAAGAPRRRRPRRREDRALDGVRDGLRARRRPPAAGASRSPLAVGVGGLAVGGEHLGHAPQQLRQDRAGVAPGADQRAVRHRPYRVGSASRRERAPRRGAPQDAESASSCAAKTASTAAAADSTVR